MASWKKIITSGSNAELNQITSSAGININGTLNSISNGLTFGDGNTGFFEDADNSIRLVRGGSMVFQANTSSQLNIGVSNLFHNSSGGFNIKTGASTTSPNYTFHGNTDTGIGRPAANQVSIIAGGVQELIIKANTISGSLASTGSFGRVEATTFVGDGSGLTGLTSAAIETYNTSGDNRILTSVNSSTVQGEAGLTFDGSELRVQGDIVAENFIVSSSVTHMTQSFSSGSTIFGDSTGDTHQFTGSVSISGSASSTIPALTVASAGSNGIGLQLEGDVISQTPLIKFKSAGGNLPGGGTIGFTNQGFRFTSTLTSTGGIVANSGFNTSQRGSKGAMESGNGGNAGIGFTGLGGNAGIDFQTSNTTRLDIAVDGTVTIVEDTIMSGSTEVLGNISGSATSTGSFGRTEGTSFSYVFDDAGSLVYDNDELVYRNGSAEKFKVDNSQLTTQVVNATQQIKIGGENKIKLDETSVSLVISQNDGGMQDNLTLTKEGNLTLHRGALTTSGNVTVGGNLIVQGDTVQQNVANLNVEDRFILLNSGSASGDGGIVVQTESADGDGVAFAYDDSESRWSFQQGTKLNASASAVAPDAYASAVVTSDDANYRKNGNIRVEGGEIYIYVE